MYNKHSNQCLRLGLPIEFGHQWMIDPILGFDEDLLPTVLQP